MNVHTAEPIFIAVFHKPLTGVYHENAFANMGIFFIKHNNAGRNARTVKEVGWQADNSLDISFFNNILADLGFRVAPEQNPVGKDAGALALAFQSTDNMKQIGVIPVFRRGNAIVFKPAMNITNSINAIAPAFITEWGISNNIVIGFKRALFIEKKRICQGVTLHD